MLDGLRTAIYVVEDLEAARSWYAGMLGFEPYFDEPFYVGFEVGGYELGLLPGEPDAETMTYWGVPDIRGAMEHLISLGVIPNEKVREVGQDILTASVQDPFGNTLGLIENPHFKLPVATTD
ncbi:VOC family protein [Rubrobacter indicoceani]|uniref:VOC family protein n=1 Tax=Rubrobacter indicoceani TaxID=2051957 RepID=UPI000E5B58D6|nr:VOC family protein [Rubrobacter indicoceani]